MPSHASLRTLHPTQMTLGFREVARRMANYLRLEEELRPAYIAARVVPCVIGPGRRLYLLDRHHMCRALLDAGVEEVHVGIVEDFGGVAPSDFWRLMDDRGWVHPFDSQGVRRDHGAIPGELAALVDDPYRALASVVRREDGYAKADLPFEEFIWANFLRHRIPADRLRHDFAAAVAAARDLARSSDAAHLPGWIGVA